MFSGDSNIDWGATTTASQDVTLIYNYTPGVPEPFSMVLSGSGLALVLLGRKRLVRPEAADSRFEPVAAFPASAAIGSASQSAHGATLYY